MHLIPFSFFIEQIKGVFPIDENDTDVNAACAGIRILSDNTQTYKSDFLYLTDDQSILAIEWSQQLPSRVAITVSAELTELPISQSWKRHCVLLRTDCSLQEVRDALQDILDNYRDWREACMDMILAGAPLPDLLDYAVSMLANPIAFFDSAGVLVHQAGTFNQDPEGTLWAEVLESGFAPTEAVYPDEQSRIMRETREGARLITGVFRKDPRYHFITIPVQVDGKNTGAFGMLDINAPFTNGQRAMALEIGSITALALRSHTPMSLIENEENYCILRLLQNLPVDHRALRQFLMGKRWNDSDAWHLFQFPLHDPDRAQTQVSAYIYRLGHIMPRAVLFQYENAILAVSRKVDFNPDMPESLKHLSQALDRMSLHGIVSGCIYSLTDLSIAHSQCRLIGQYGSAPTETILRFEDAFQKILFGIFQENNDIRGFCHPAVLRLWESGSEKNRTLVYDLKYYLLNGRSIADTARYLNLHRNTFIYRLQKLEEILDMPLNSISETSLLHLLFSCIICESVGKQANSSQR